MTAFLIFKKLGKQFQGNSEQFENAQITRSNRIIASYSACHMTYQLTPDHRELKLV